MNLLTSITAIGSSKKGEVHEVLYKYEYFDENTATIEEASRDFQQALQSVVFADMETMIHINDLLHADKIDVAEIQLLFDEVMNKNVLDVSRETSEEQKEEIKENEEK